MAKFDPKKAREDGNQGIPPSDYLLAIRSLERKVSKKGKDYLLVKIGVIAGAAKGKTFRDIISLDISNDGTKARLGILLEETGEWRVETDDLDSDADLRRALVGKPFKAKVKRVAENGYVNNGIERYFTGDKVTDGERETMSQWAIERGAEQDWEGGGGPPDDDAPHSANSGIDDDIPF